MPSCPDCGAPVNEDDKFCRNCDRSLQPLESKSESSVETVEIAGMRERIKEYGRESKWVLIGGFVMSLLVVVFTDGKVYRSFSLSVFFLIYAPFLIMCGILLYNRYKLQRELKKRRLN